MPLVPITDLGSVGIIKDMPPYAIPPSAWSNGNNIRFLNNGVKKIRGYTEVMATCPFAPYYIFPYEDASGNYYWFAFGEDDVAVWDNTDWTDITRQKTLVLDGPVAASAATITVDTGAALTALDTSGTLRVGTGIVSDVGVNEYEVLTYSTIDTGTGVITLTGTTAEAHPDNAIVTPNGSTDTADEDYDANTTTRRWTATNLNGIVIATNGYDTPQMWPLTGGLPDKTHPMIELSNWPATPTASISGSALQKCSVIRSFRTFLVGLNWQRTDPEPRLVKWSTEASYYSAPNTWDEADATLDAGEYELADTPGEIVDGLPLGDSFIIYKNDSIYIMNYVGTPYIFSFKLLNPNIGCLTKNAVAEFEGGHFFMGNSDFYLNDGQSIKPLLPDKLRRAVFDEINAGDVSNPSWMKCFVVADHLHTEMLACYPSDNSTIVNKAVIWNWRANTFSFRDLPTTSHIASGIMAVFPAGQKWGPAATLDESSMTPSSPATAGNLDVVSTTSTPAFSSAGTLIINGSGSTVDGLSDIGAEQISYTGTTSTSFTNITRGANSTTATAHTDASMINEVTTSWNSNTNAWGSSAYDTHLENLVFADVSGIKMYRDNNGNKENTNDMTSYVERTGYDFGDPQQVKIVTAIYPEMEATGGSSISIRIGTQMAPEGGVTWSNPILFDPVNQSKVSCRQSGKYFGIQFESTTDMDWKLHSLAFEVKPQGKRGSRSY